MFEAITLDLMLNGLSPFIFVMLIFIAGFTSMLTASLGAGGGMLMLGVLAQVLPPQVIIPLHGVIQLGSNVGRAGMNWRHIDWKFIGLLVPGAVLGSILGHFVLVALPPSVMYLTIASFILYLCWGPKLPKLILGQWGIIILGGITSFLTLFVGATGPIIAGFLKQMHTDKFRTVATFAAALSLQHVFKIMVFQVAGFEVMPWLPLLVAMIISGAFGTWVGLNIMKRLPDKQFQQIFNWVLTLFALRLIWQAVISFE